MPGHDRHCRGHRTMSDGNSCIGRYRHGSGYTRHNLEIDSCSRHGFCFFPSSTKYKRIAALQSNDNFPGSCTINEETIDFSLVLISTPPPTTYIDPFCSSRNIVQQGRIGQVIVQDDLSTLKAFFPFDGDQAWLTWSRSYKAYLSTSRSCRHAVRSIVFRTFSPPRARS